MSGPDVIDWRAQSRSFAALAHYRAGETSVTVGNAVGLRDGRAHRPGLLLRGRCHRAHRAAAHRRRGLARRTARRGDQRRATGGGSSPAIRGVVGTTLTLDQRTLTIVGVTAPGFRFPARADLYTAEPGRLATLSRSGHNYRAVGRLAPGVSLAQARAEMTGIAARLSAEYPRSNADKGVRLTPLQDAIVGETRQTLFVLLGAVAFVLLIACANVANLLLARASARGREIVVRAAVGAGRARLVRQLLTESVVLAVVAGIAGALIARVGVTTLVALAPPDLPRLDEVTVDASALAFALGISLAASLVFGLAPAWHVSRVDLADGLRQGGKGSALGDARRLGAQGVRRRRDRARGGPGDGRRAARAEPRGAGPGGHGLCQRAPGRAAYDRAGRRPRRSSRARPLSTVGCSNEIRGLPEVASTGAVTALPSVPQSNGSYWIEGAPGPEAQTLNAPQALFTVVTPGYFETLGVPVVRGRDVADGDRLDAPFVAVVNEQLVTDAFPGVDPIGRTLRAGLDSLTPMTIVGVVKNVRTRGPGRPVQAEIYFPFEQHPGPATTLNLVVRARAGDPLAAGAAAARVIRSRHADVPVRLEAMTTTLAASTATPRFRTALLVVFAGVALVLAVAGVYGVMAYTVSQRVPEIGLRVALGATPRDVLGLVLKDGGVLVAAGLILGTALTLAGSRLLSGLLFSVSARDPLVLAGVALLVGLAALGACLVPGRRALKVDPLLALRAE